MTFPWNEHHIARLREEYPVNGSRNLVAEWRITRSAIIAKARKLKVLPPRDTRLPAEKLAARQEKMRGYQAAYTQRLKLAGETNPKPRVDHEDKSGFSHSSFGRSSVAATEQAVERARQLMKSPKRRCSYRHYEGNGKSLPCHCDASPHSMWCDGRAHIVAQIKECA